MPTYEYQCAECGGKFEVRASMKERERGMKPACPTCGGKQVLPLVSTVSVGGSAKTAAASCCSGSGCCPPRRG